MPRTIWKGAIAFSLVNIPVALYPASGADELKLHLLDRRDFAPVGNQRINKRTGKPVAAEDIVKGYEYEEDQYVVVGDEDFRQANVKATQTVDIVGFVAASEIPAYYFDTPYYLEPTRQGAKSYALLRETLRRSGRIGLAMVVIRTRQHLAALLPVDQALVLNTLRFASEIRPMAALALPGEELKALGIAAGELTLAERLVDDMTVEWSPKQYHDTYTDDLMARIQRKVEAGESHLLAEPAAEKEPAAGAEVIDLMALLKRSLERPPAKEGKAAKGGRAAAQPRRKRA